MYINVYRRHTISNSGQKRKKKGGDGNSRCNLACVKVFCSVMAEETTLS